MTGAMAARTSPKWWQWQPAGTAETLLYLLAMAIFSGLFSVALNALFSDGGAWGHFVPGAITGVVFNAITLWVKRHRHKGVGGEVLGVGEVNTQHLRPKSGE